VLSIACCMSSGLPGDLMRVGIITLLACLRARLLDCERPAARVTQVQIYSKVHKPPLKVNNFSAFPNTNFRNVRRIVSDRRDASGGLCHAELGSASACEKEQAQPMLGRLQEALSALVCRGFPQREAGPTSAKSSSSRLRPGKTTIDNTLVQRRAWCDLSRPFAHR
jgi:hypothetical protein